MGRGPGAPEGAGQREGVLPDGLHIPTMKDQNPTVLNIDRIGMLTL
jgi:hypothetical protein